MKSKLMQRFMKNLLVHEGGYSDHPEDRGGPTKYGVTIGTLRQYRRDPTLTAEDVKALTQDEAAAIYEQEYLTGPKIDHLPDCIMEQTFDMSVNHGPRTAIKIVQTVVGQIAGKRITKDGVIGPVTLATAQSAIDRAGVAAVVNGIAHERLAFYERIIENDPSQEVFRKGWRKRAESFMVAKKAAGKKAGAKKATAKKAAAKKGETKQA